MRILVIREEIKSKLNHSNAMGMGVQQQLPTTFKVHFARQFKMNSFLILVHEIPDSHTAVNISEEVTDVLSKWSMLLQTM